MICRVFVKLLFCFIILSVCSCSSREADAGAHLEAARNHAEASHYHDALREFDKTIQLLNEDGNRRHDLLMMSYNGMGSISFIFGDTLTAIIWYKRAWQESNAVNNNDYKARISSNLAIAYNSIGKTDSARIYNTTLRGLLDRDADIPYYQYFFNLGRIEYASGNDRRAIVALDSAIMSLNDTGAKRENSEIYILMAKAFLRIGDKEKTAEFAKLGDVNVEFETNDNNRLRAYRDLANIYTQLGDNLKADSYGERAISLRESIINNNQSLKIAPSHEDESRVPTIVLSVMAIVAASIASVLLLEGV